jgi:hypothetical protein
MSDVSIVLVVLLVAALLWQPGYTRWGWYGGGGIIGLVLLILLILILTGSIHVAHAADLYAQTPPPPVLVQPVVKLDPPALVAIGAFAAGLTQIIKMGTPIPDGWGLWIVSAVALAAILGWAITFEAAFSRDLIWPYLNAWLNTVFAAGGIFGIVRAMTPAQATSLQRPPAGLAQHHTEGGPGD